MEGTALLWIAILTLVLLSAGLLWQLRRVHRTTKDRLEEAAASAEARLEELQASHASQISHQGQEYSESLSRMQAQHSASEHQLRNQVQQLTTQNEELSTILHRDVGSDRVSRDRILRACRNIGLNGALLTNLRFVASSKGAPYQHQIDHLLITESCAAIFENKHWRGIIFDGRHPADVDSSWEPLTRGIPLENEFAVHVTVPEGTAAHRAFTMRVHAAGMEKTAPRRQVLRQVAALSELLRGAPDFRWTTFIHPAVFYSHQDARVVTSGPTIPDKAGSVAILSCQEDLERFLRVKASPRAAGIDVAAVVDWLKPNATDVTGLGTYSAKWDPVLK